ncbi:YbaK/EbsC family protein [Pseudolysinimonas sp.]|uniref:YbaK/EbsC family protein n=1 Tax=Pseudolysinimonas sp. TaxID=2680009 RepID=UPI00286CB059|nr:YbaK/EbsC family protein [Pseudolysinimonas sp.]
MPRLDIVENVTENYPRGVENVRAVLRAAGVAGADRIRHIPDGARTAAEAAAALGVEVGAIANSLVFVADGNPLLVMTSGGHRVDTVVLSARIGVEAIERATPEIVRVATGQAIGGVAPVGHPAPLRTIVDPVLETFPEIWAAAGHSHAVFPLTYEQLVRITGGTVVPVD